MLRMNRRARLLFIGLSLLPRWAAYRQRMDAKWSMMKSRSLNSEMNRDLNFVPPDAEILLIVVRARRTDAYRFLNEKPLLLPRIFDYFSIAVILSLPPFSRDEFR